MLIFLVLSGSTAHFPFNRFYWLRADTTDIGNAAGESAWTFWGVCDYKNFSSCSVGPAYPLSPIDNFETTRNVPDDFVSNRDTFYYLTRFSFAFFLIALGFTAFALIIDILGFCFTVIDKVVNALVVIALLFVMGGSAMQTAANVLARNAFTSDGRLAHIGVKNMALAWASVAAMLLVFFITCAANIARSYKKHIQNVNGAKEEHNYYNHDGAQPGAPLGDESSFTRGGPEEKGDAGSGGIRFFRIKRNQKTSDEESV